MSVIALAMSARSSSCSRVMSKPSSFFPYEEGSAFVFTTVVAGPFDQSPHPPGGMLSGHNGYRRPRSVVLSGVAPSAALDAGTPMHESTCSLVSPTILDCVSRATYARSTAHTVSPLAATANAITAAVCCRSLICCSLLPRYTVTAFPACGQEAVGCAPTF